MPISDTNYHYKRDFTDIDELYDLWHRIDAFQDFALDIQCALESGNWGCPVEGSERERQILVDIFDSSKILLERINEWIEIKEKEECPRKGFS